MNVGIEWVVDAEGCSENLLRDFNTIKRVCERIIKDLSLNVAGEPLWRQFPTPGGITGLILLTESHLACHTYPESGLATFNLYCCRLRPEWPWQSNLGEMLGATRVTVRSLIRGQAGDGLEAASFATESYSGREG